jgi:hypothetical protein
MNNEDKNDSIGVLTKEFYIIYHTLLNNRNQTIYAEKINDMLNEYNVCMYKAYFTQINYIKSLIFNLRDEHLDYSYKITLLHYVKSDLFNKLIECKIIKFNKENIIDSNALEIVIYSSRILRNALTFTNAFTMMSELSDYIRPNSGNMMINANKDIILYNESKTEIIDRLDQLNRYFGINLFIAIDIKRIRRDIVLEHSYNELVIYYNDLVKKIQKYIKKYMHMCDAYVEIEKAHVLSLISGNEIFDLDNIENFELSVKDDTDNNDSDTE